MRKIIFISALMLGTTAAQADNSLTNSGALALAALVGWHALDLPSADKQILASMLIGDLAFISPPSGQIEVKAESVSCRSSNVDISEHDCTLKFGAATRMLKGREAHELYATLVENGVVPDGAAGSIYAALSHLDCIVKPDEVKQKAGGGASCTSQPGP